MEGQMEDLFQSFPSPPRQQQHHQQQACLKLTLSLSIHIYNRHDHHHAPSSPLTHLRFSIPTLLSTPNKTFRHLVASSATHEHTQLHEHFPNPQTPLYHSTTSTPPTLLQQPNTLVSPLSLSTTKLLPFIEMDSLLSEQQRFKDLISLSVIKPSSHFLLERGPRTRVCLSPSPTIFFPPIYSSPRVNKEDKLKPSLITSSPSPFSGCRGLQFWFAAQAPIYGLRSGHSFYVSRPLIVLPLQPSPTTRQLCAPSSRLQFPSTILVTNTWKTHPPPPPL